MALYSVLFSASSEVYFKNGLQKTNFYSIQLLKVKPSVTTVKVYGNWMDIEVSIENDIVDRSDVEIIYFL